MRTMTIPSATMRRLKQAAAASRASQAAASAPVIRRPVGDGAGATAAGGPWRVHRTSPSPGKRHATAGGDSSGRGNVRLSRPAAAAAAAAQGSSSSSSLGKSRATAPPASGRAVRAPPTPPSAPSADSAADAGHAAAVAVGDRVLVQTPVTHTAAGQHIIMTIGAVVVSAVEEDGESCFDVVLDGNYPPHDPSSTVRIARDQIVSTPAAATKPSASSARRTNVPGPEPQSKRKAVGSVTSLRGAEQQTSLQNARASAAGTSFAGSWSSVHR